MASIGGSMHALVPFNAIFIQDEDNNNGKIMINDVDN